MLKKASAANAALLVDIRRRAILAQPESLWTREQITAAADYLTLEKINTNFTDHEIYIHEDTAFVGFKDNYLAYLFALPELQGKGIGTKMLEFAEGIIRQKHNTAWLFAHPYAEKFYERHGYKKQPQTENPFGVVLYKFEKQF